MFCAKCGSEVAPNTKFCAKCGAPVMGGGSGSTPVEEPPKKKPPVGLIIAIVIAGLVFVAVMIGGIFLVRSHSSDISDEDGWSDQRDAEDVDKNDLENEDSEKNPAENPSENENGSAADDAADTAEPVEVTDVDISIRQVDNSNFPEVTFYANVMDLVNNEPVDGLAASDFEIHEYDVNGNPISTKIKDVHKVDASKDRISMNLVLDASGSMNDYDKMPQAQSAADALVSHMNLAGGDRVEIISFDDYVYMNQEFTSDSSLLLQAIDNISPGSSTALYDGLYSGIYQTNKEDGVKCVVGFTDGEENASNYSYNDVVNLSRETGIPVYIVGVGGDVNSSDLQSLAYECSGSYYSADETNLEEILKQIYFQIYQNQKDYYVFTYESSDRNNLHDFRRIELTASEHSRISGSFEKEYTPVSDINGNFQNDYASLDYILDFTSSREITASDLADLSLAELRIARNEIFARHGRQFNDPMLNQWFYSKQWYLDLPYKYAPNDFDKNNPDPLSKLESKNAQFIRDYEKEMMEYNDIYPEASTVQLSGYDLALDKATLKKALKQVKGYSQTDIRDENIKLIKEAIKKEDIQY